MNIASHRRALSRAVSICAFVIVSAFAVTATASAQKSGIPEHAYVTTTSYGKGWECQRGFRESGNKCIEVRVPENAYLDDRGDQWQCRRGYRQEKDTCELIVVPKNAFLTEQGYGGVGWTCERGYRAVGSRCEWITVPKNAFLHEASYGPGWVCERGYQAVEERCIPVVVPKNAHLGYGGDSWECDEPLVLRDGNCVTK